MQDTLSGSADIDSEKHLISIDNSSSNYDFDPDSLCLSVAPYQSNDDAQLKQGDGLDLRLEESQPEYDGQLNYTCDSFTYVGIKYIIKAPLKTVCDILVVIIYCNKLEPF